jgi:hypothetical protein
MALPLSSSAALGALAEARVKLMPGDGRGAHADAQGLDVCSSKISPRWTGRASSLNMMHSLGVHDLNVGEDVHRILDAVVALGHVRDISRNPRMEPADAARGPGTR